MTAFHLNYDGRYVDVWLAGDPRAGKPDATCDTWEQVILLLRREHAREVYVGPGVYAGFKRGGMLPRAVWT